MFVNFVKAKIGNNELNCAITPNYTGPPLCNEKFLKRCGGKITRVISPEDKLNYKEIDNQTIGWTILPLVFTSNVNIKRLKCKGNSITIMTQLLVGNFPYTSQQHILLGLDWFTGRKYQDFELQIYRILFVTEAEEGYIRSTLRIIDLRRPKKEKVVMDFWNGILHGPDDSSDDSSDDGTDIHIGVKRKSY